MDPNVSTTGKFICQNPACRKLVPLHEPEDPRIPPLCACGGALKRVYERPMVRKWTPTSPEHKV